MPRQRSSISFSLASVLWTRAKRRRFFSKVSASARAPASRRGAVVVGQQVEGGFERQVLAVHGEGEGGDGLVEEPVPGGGADGGLVVEELLQLVRQLVGLHRAEAVEDGLVAGEVGVLREASGEVGVLDPVDLEREEDERRGEGGDAVLRVGDELGALGVGGVLVVAEPCVGHEAARDGVDLLVAQEAGEEVGGGEGGELALVVGGEAGAGVLEPVHVALELGRVGGGVEVGQVPVGEGAEILAAGGVRVEDGGFHGPCSYALRV
jgi:hypothetical protein